MKKFLTEFKSFAMRGNVVDMAIGVVIGAAFSAIVTSLVNDLFSPLIGLIASTNLKDQALTFAGVSINYGSFLTALINFIITAFVLFVVVKGMNKLSAIGHKPEAPGAPTTKICPFCKSEIPLDATRCAHCTSILDDLNK